MWPPINADCFSTGLHGSSEPWMTLDEASKFLEVPLRELEELMRTGQVDVGGSSLKPLVLRKSALTYRRLRERLG